MLIAFPTAQRILKNGECGRDNVGRRAAKCHFLLMRRPLPSRSHDSSSSYFSAPCLRKNGSGKRHALPDKRHKELWIILQQWFCNRFGGTGVASVEHPLVTPQGSKISSSSVFTQVTLIMLNRYKTKCNSWSEKQTDREELGLIEFRRNRGDGGEGAWRQSECVCVQMHIHMKLPRNKFNKKIKEWTNKYKYVITNVF